MQQHDGLTNMKGKHAELSSVNVNSRQVYCNKLLYSSKRLLQKYHSSLTSNCQVNYGVLSISRLNVILNTVTWNEQYQSSCCYSSWAGISCQVAPFVRAPIIKILLKSVKFFCFWSGAQWKPTLTVSVVNALSLSNKPHYHELPKVT